MPGSRLCAMLKFELSHGNEFHGMISMKSDCSAHALVPNPTSYRAVLRAIGAVDEKLWVVVRHHLSQTVHIGDADGDGRITIKDVNQLGEESVTFPGERISRDDDAEAAELDKRARELFGSIKCQEWAHYFTCLNIRDHPADLVVEAATNSPGC